MAIAFRELQFDTADGSTPVVTFTTLVSGDLIVFACGNNNDETTTVEIQDGNSNPGTIVQASSNGFVEGCLSVFHYTGGSQVFSAGPDAPDDGICLGALAFSGVNVSNIAGGSFSGGHSTNTNTTTNPNPTSVAMTAGSVSVVAALSGVNDAAKTLPTGYGNEIDVSINSSRPISLGMGSKDIVSTGTEDPAGFGGWSSGAWIAWTLELLPAAGSVGRRLIGPGAKLSRMSLVRSASPSFHTQKTLVGFDKPRLVGFDQRIVA